MIKRYKFEYDYWWNVSFEINDEVYTDDIAQLTLDFFCWTYNTERKPTVEVLKKICIECIGLSIQGWNKHGVISEFDNLEGFPKLDGSLGITLLEIDDFRFDSNDFHLLSVENK